jgi:hypothetical protein
MEAKWFLKKRFFCFWMETNVLFEMARDLYPFEIVREGAACSGIF